MVIGPQEGSCKESICHRQRAASCHKVMLGTNEGGRLGNQNQNEVFHNKRILVLLYW